MHTHKTRNFQVVFSSQISYYAAQNVYSSLKCSGISKSVSIPTVTFIKSYKRLSKIIYDTVATDGALEIDYTFLMS